MHTEGGAPPGCTATTLPVISPGTKFKIAVSVAAPQSAARRNPFRGGRSATTFSSTGALDGIDEEPGAEPAGRVSSTRVGVCGR